MYKKTIKRGEKKYTYYINIKRNKKFSDTLLNSNKNKKNGFHNLVIISDENPTSTQTEYKESNLYKNFLVCDNLTKLRSHNLVIALDLKSGVLHRHLGSNSLLMMNFPASASKN